MIRYVKYMFAMLVVPLVLMGAQCTQQQATTTLSDVQAEIVAACHYQADIASIAAVAATIASTVDAAAGATATVLVSVGNSVATQICQAVQAQQAKQSARAGAGAEVIVTVNGVPVHGTIVP